MFGRLLVMICCSFAFTQIVSGAQEENIKLQNLGKLSEKENPAEELPEATCNEKQSRPKTDGKWEGISALQKELRKQKILGGSLKDAEEEQGSSTKSGAASAEKLGSPQQDDGSMNVPLQQQLLSGAGNDALTEEPEILADGESKNDKVLTVQKGQQEDNEKLESENATLLAKGSENNACDGWCKDDIAKHGIERLCHGNMAWQCGGCSFCGAPAPPPAPPTPGGNSWSTLCKDPQPMGTGHGWWKKRNSAPSCNCGKHWPWQRPPPCYRDDGVKYCGADETSISMDMGEVGNKKGCWVYASRGQKQWNINTLKTIEWDAEWENCDNMWLAPLWMTPGRWIAPQGLSGEIDFMESCKGHSPRNNFGTSIICSQHPSPDCYDKVWGPQDSSNGVQHFSGKIDSEGTWTLHRTTKTNDSPELISRYPYYTKKIHWHTDFSLVSDIFNGGHGDSGWSGCGQLNWATQCRFVIANIKVNT